MTIYHTVAEKKNSIPWHHPDDRIAYNPASQSSCVGNGLV